MTATPRPLMLLAAAAGTLLALAGPAMGAKKIICVNSDAPECGEYQPNVGTLGDQLQAAITTTAANPGDDTIHIGPGDYSRAGGFVYGSPADGRLLITGSAAAESRLSNPNTSPSENTFRASVPSGGGVVLTDVTIVVPSNSGTGVTLAPAGSWVKSSRIVAAPSTTVRGTGVRSGAGFTLVDTEITGVNTGADVSGATLTVLRVSVDAAQFGVVAGTDDATIRRARIRVTGGNAFALWFTKGTNLVENTVLDAVNTDPDMNNNALVTTCADGSSSTTARYVTMRSATSAGVSASCSTPSRTAGLTIGDSVLAPGTDLGASGSGAGVTIARSRWDGTTGPGVSTGPGLRTDDPRFVAADDLRLAAGSPLIDAGTVTGSTGDEPYSGGDVLGGPRVLDGDGDGVATPDLGAYEHAYAAPPPGPGTGAGEAPPVPGPAGTTPPLAPVYRGVTIRAGRVTLDARRRAAFLVTCPVTTIGRCTGTVALTRTVVVKRTKRIVTLGRANVSIRPGSRATVRVVLTRHVASQLPRRGVPATVRATTRDARSTTRARLTTARVTLLPAPRPKTPVHR